MLDLSTNNILFLIFGHTKSNNIWYTNNCECHPPKEKKIIEKLFEQPKSYLTQYFKTVVIILIIYFSLSSNQTNTCFYRILIRLYQTLSFFFV